MLCVTVGIASTVTKPFNVTYLFLIIACVITTTALLIAPPLLISWCIRQKTHGN